MKQKSELSRDATDEQVLNTLSFKGDPNSTWHQPWSIAYLQCDGELCVRVTGRVDIAGPDDQMVLLLTLSIQLTCH